MSSYYKNRNRKEPQIKIGSKYENVEYSSKNIDPNMNYLNRQLYEEESLKKARQKRQLEEYSYYAKALENSRPPSEKFHSKVNYDNLTGKIGQEKMEEEFRKYQQSKSKVDSNAFAKPPTQDMRSMNYHGYNIINNNILGFCDPNQKFPSTSYQQTYQGKPLQKELNNLTPSQYEDYQAFRREELERMKRTQQPPVNSNQPQIEMKEDPKTQAMKNELQREREYLEKQRALEVEQRKMNEMQRNYQSQDAYMKMRQEVDQNPNDNPCEKMTQEDYERYMQMQAMQNNNTSNPNKIPPQSEPIEPKPQIPNQNEDPNQQGPKLDDELYRKAYEQYLLEQQQKDNPNPKPPKEEIPPKEPINQPNDNIPQGGVDPNNKEYMEYMNKKAQEEMEQREYLARMTPKQREQYEKEMYLREQEYYRQMQSDPRLKEQQMMPNQPSNEDYEREQYMKYLQEKQMAENKPQPTMSEQERREREEYERYLQSQAMQNQQPSNVQQTLSPEDEARAREEYEQYMRAQEMQRGGNPQYSKEQEQYLKAKQMAEEEYRAKEEKERQEYMEYLKQQSQTVPKEQPQPSNDEREKYLEYLRAQSQNPQQQLPPSNPNEPPKENTDPEYLKKLKQYEEIVQGNESNSDINRIPSAQRRQYDMSQNQLPPKQRSPYDNYPSSQRTPGQNPPMNYHMARQQAIQAATPGKITKSNYIPSNPYSEKKYNLGKSNLSTNPITNPINSYKFDYNRLNNPLINTGRLANAGSNIINK